jgi:Skp family chaperone for outer membrane proteins
MRIIRLFAATLFIAAIAAIPAFAQQRGGVAQPASTPPSAATAQPGGPVPVSKIAFINTDAFRDEKNGIARFVAALKNLDREFKPRIDEMQAMANRLKTINDDIQKLSGNPVVDEKSVNAKREEGESIQRDLEYKKKQYDAAAAKRYEEVVGPISNDIGNALTNYAKAHGITMILDASKMLEAIITLDPNMDITAEFVNEYNSKNPATASTTAPGR